MFEICLLSGVMGAKGMERAVAIGSGNSRLGKEEKSVRVIFRESRTERERACDFSQAQRFQEPNLLTLFSV